ncbi:MAG: DUF4469 domain-containing protein [Spirochaetaceae bacterium]|jgi:hypothetical protein|nr:DUF4469 domain-containing protein [Spirochaetaceae bacterium]
MALDFITKDIMHHIAAKFIHAYLPDAKKPYNLRAVHQPELDIHGIASKADVYNITTPPKVIEEGLTAGLELIYYLAADGYKAKTPLFNLSVKFPGEYDGSETHLAEGVRPVARLSPSAAFRSYIAQKVQVDFDGIDQTEGHIGEARDEATGLIDDVMTAGNIITLHGSGLKIESDAAHSAEAGLFFEDDAGDEAKASVIAVNEPRTLKAVVPAFLKPGTAYRLKIVTQSSAKNSSTILKDLRKISSEFTLTAQ